MERCNFTGSRKGGPTGGAIQRGRPAFYGCRAGLEKMRTHGRVALRERAQAYRVLGQSENAIKDYQQLVQSQPADFKDRLSMADVLFESGSYQEAAEWYRQLADSDEAPDFQTWVQFRLALSYQRIGKTNEAADLLTELRSQDEQAEELGSTIRAAASAVLKEFVPRKKVLNVSGQESN